MIPESISLPWLKKAGLDTPASVQLRASPCPWSHPLLSLCPRGSEESVSPSRCLLLDKTALGPLARTQQVDLSA